MAFRCLNFSSNKDNNYHHSRHTHSQKPSLSTRAKALLANFSCLPRKQRTNRPPQRSRTELKPKPKPKPQKRVKRYEPVELVPGEEELWGWYLEWWYCGLRWELYFESSRRKPCSRGEHLIIFEDGKRDWRWGTKDWDFGGGLEYWISGVCHWRLMRMEFI